MVLKKNSNLPILVMTLPFMASLNLKLKTTLIRFRIFHKNTCVSMKHAHSPYAHIILQMLSTHWVKFKPISYFNAQILHCICSLYPNCSGCCPIHTKQTEIYKEHDKKEINATNAQR
jgi:hypothetical protein